MTTLATHPVAVDLPTLDSEILDGLMELADDGDDFVRDLYATWVDSYRKSLSGMNEARHRADGDALRRAAHALKGASANVGAARVAALCAELQEAGEAEDFDAAGPLVAALPAEFDRVLAELGRRFPGFEA